MNTSMRKSTAIVPAILALVVAFAMSSASALEYQEVQSLVRDRVPENVIINMAKADTSLYITTEQADELRRMGASENLITALRPRATTAPAPSYPSTPAPSAPVIVSRPPSRPVQPAQPVPSQATSVEGQPVFPAQVTISSAMPARYDKEGWVSISNRDWMPYYINVNVSDKRMFLSRNPNGGFEIQSGQNIALNLRKNTYKLYGDSGNKLEVKIREDEVTTLSLEPFGVFGNSGLTGVAVDRDKVRTEVLVSNYSPAPTVIVEESPSVIVVPPPAVYYRRHPYYRHGGGFYFDYYHR